MRRAILHAVERYVKDVVIYIMSASSRCVFSALFAVQSPKKIPRDRNVAVENELFVQSKAVNLFSRINSYCSSLVSRALRRVWESAIYKFVECASIEARPIILQN